MPGKADYQRLRTAHLNAVAAALDDHVARLDWPRERIDHHRDRRLRLLLGYARERSPFHARRLHDIDPDTATVADLAALPAMTKQQAQEHWDQVITVGDLDRAGAERILAEQTWFSYTAHDQQVFSSGGSTGVRGVYVWDWLFFVSAAALAWRLQVRDERRVAPSGPTRLAVISAALPPHASTPLFDVPTVDGMQTVVIEAGAPFDEVLANVAAAAPTHLVGYASVIGRLARAALAGDLSITPRRVSTNSEPLLPEDREAISRAWNSVIHNLWGSTEIGVQAVGCGYGEGLHICEDEVILERVDGRTLATGLANRTFPFIRYDLGDEITLLSEPCPCGSAFTRVAEVAGRRDDDFVYGPVTVPASTFRHVLGTDPRITEYQVIQTATGADIAVVGSPDESVAHNLVAAVGRYGLSSAEITVRTVPRLDRNPNTGKLSRFVPLR